MPIQSTALVHAYLGPLAELAERDGGMARLERIGEELAYLAELMRTDQRFREFIRSPIIDPLRRESSLKRMFEGRLDDLLLRALLVANRRRRLGTFTAIPEAWESLLNRKLGKIEVDIYVPRPLQSQELAALRERIEAALGGESAIHVYVDRGMIGGIRIRVGDRLVDGSIIRLLTRLRQAASQSVYTAVRERFERIVHD